MYSEFINWNLKIFGYRPAIKGGYLLQANNFTSLWRSRGWVKRVVRNEEKAPLNRTDVNSIVSGRSFSDIYK